MIIQPCPGCAATNQVQIDRIAALEVRLKDALEDARVTTEELGVRLTERDEARADAQALREDAERLDWLERELEREQDERLAGNMALPRSLFRRNVPITRATIDAARKDGNG